MAGLKARVNVILKAIDILKEECFDCLECFDLFGVQDGKDQNVEAKPSRLPETMLSHHSI